MACQLQVFDYNKLTNNLSYIFLCYITNLRSDPVHLFCYKVLSKHRNNSILYKITEWTKCNLRGSR
jgi:hypothetical protein